MGIWWPTCVAAAVSVFAVIVFPRAPTWQIVEMKYRGVSIDFWGMGIDMRVDLGLEVSNPNYVPAKLKGLVMTMFHHNLVGEEAPFGMITFTAKDATFLPARGSAVVKAEMEVVSMPSSMAMSIAKDAADEGVIVSRTTAVMEGTVLGGDLLVDADCIQHLRTDVFPMQIVLIDCKYYYKSVPVPILQPRR
ncbi:unnamed protein product [Ascophyllum nodosum]